MRFWIDQLLREYGETLGLTSFQANTNGVALLTYENGQQLYLEDREESLSVSLLHDSDGYELLAQLQQALRMCHFHNANAIQVRPGLLGDTTLSLSVIVRRQDATVSYLEAVINRLQRFLADIFN